VGLPRLNQPFVKGAVETALGKVPQVSSTLMRADKWGTIKARCGVGRMHYKVEPGLYALGTPDERSPVLVTANYKMSFDSLRSALPGQRAWILVLDTQGINVWCAAGKGTFGTQELVGRLESSGLAKVVAHRELILPQLSAPGVAAHQVKRLSGFKAIYGPIRATDLPAFMAAGLKATPEMRRKTFTLGERAILVPVELATAPKWIWAIFPLVFLLGGVAGHGGFWASGLDHGLFAVAALLAAMLAGSVLTPLLLPWLPGRAFSLKGLSMGLLAAAILAAWRGDHLASWSGCLEAVGWVLLVLSVASHLAMEFTGASTYTSLSGVKREMRWALPAQIGAATLGLVLWLGGLFAV
jgi:acetyl-CoA decarbonylase/synthase complex subunit gamma